MRSLETELAWCAGFFDGEGCTSHVRSRNHHNARLNVTQKDRRTLYRFQAAVGCGNISKVRIDNGVSTWTTGALKDIYHVLDLLWPYLGEAKKEQAARVLDTRTFVTPIIVKCRRQGHDIVVRRGRDYCVSCQNRYNQTRSAKRRLKASL